MGGRGAREDGSRREWPGAAGIEPLASYRRRGRDGSGRLALGLWNARSDSSRLTRERRRLAGARAAGHARGRMSEEDVHDPVPAEDADELAGRAVHEDQHDEPELDGPEVRPDDLAPQVAVALREASRLPPEGDEVLQVVHEEGGGHVDDRLPHHV